MADMNIYIDENIPFLQETFKEVGNVTRFNGRKLRNEDLLKGNCECLITRSTCKVNKQLLQNTNIKFVGTATSGTDHIDSSFLSDNNIHFASALGSNANSVAEYVVYSILKWAKVKKTKLCGKKIGIIGYGNVGRLVAKYSNLLGMVAYVNDPPLLDSGFEFPEYIEYKNLEELPFLCDVITNHVPLNKVGKYYTENLIDEKFILSMNLESLMIHASRGGVVDENILLDRLITEELYACTDVFVEEPDFNTELAERSLLSSPHVAGYSFDGKVKGSLMIALAYEKYFNVELKKDTMLKHLAEYTPLSDDKYEDLEYVYKILNTRRNFEHDTKNLLSIIPLSEDDRENAFDKLRKIYPIRRESL